jgi:hypothetical protein
MYVQIRPISGIVFEPENHEKEVMALCWGNHGAYPIWPLEQGSHEPQLLHVQTIANTKHVQEGKADGKLFII